MPESEPWQTSSGESRREPEREPQPMFPSAANPLARTLDLTNPDLAEGRPWAIEGVLIEGAMTLIAGKFKQGKSTLATELAVSLATGTPLFGLPQFAVNVEPARVLVIQTENADARLSRDVNAILRARNVSTADLNVEFVNRPVPPAPRFNLLWKTHFNELLRAVERKHFRYAVLDPVYNLIGDVNVSTWDNGPTIVERLTQLRDAGCAPIITTAIKASAKYDSFDQVLGATIFGGWMESGILVRRAANERDFTIKVDVRRDRDQGGLLTHSLCGLGVGQWEVRGSATVDADTPAKPRGKHAAYRAYVEAHPTATKEQIAEALGCSTRTVERYAAKG